MDGDSNATGGTTTHDDVDCRVTQQYSARSLVLALAASAHARCGARCSPAVLSTHGATAARLLWDLVTETARFFVIRLSTWTMDWTPCPLIVTFGISPLLLGVTRSPRLLRQESPGLPLWVSPNHQIEESINPATSLMSLYLKNSAARSRVELITEIGWSFQAVNHRWLVLVRLGRKPDCPVQDDFMTIERVTDFQPVESRVELPFSHPSNYNIIRMMFTKSKPNELVVGLENARVESRVMFLVLDIEKTHSTGRTCILTNICYDFISGPLLTILPMRNRSGARSFISGVWDPRPGVHKFYNVTEGVPASLQINSSHTRLEASRISDSLFAVWLFKPTGFLSTYQVWDCSDTTAPVREVPQPEKSTLLSITAEGGFLVRVFEHHIDVVEAMTEFPVLVVEILGRQAMWVAPDEMIGAGVCEDVELVPRVTLSAQIMALMTSTQPRCGRSSPAAILTRGDVPLLQHFFAGLRSGGGAVTVAVRVNSLATTLFVGVSRCTLGVTSTTETMARHVKMDGRGHVFVPPSAIVGPPPPCRRCGVVMNIHTGVKTDVSMLDAAKGTTRGKVACVGQWIIDCENWRMWKVVVRGSLSIETLTVLGPQSVVPGEGMEIGRSGMFFVRFVDDTAFCVSYRGECVFHRISAAKAFDTGVMVPMDTVKRSVPEQLGIPSLCTFHCCWDSKRVVALGADNTMYEIQEGSQLKVLCRDVMDHFMHGGFLLVEQKGAEKRYAVWDLRGSATVGPRIVTTFAQMVQYRTFKPTGDFCVSEEKGKVHTVDSETGATIFTLTSTNIGYMNCDQLSQQVLPP